jgi:hypothetical protein
VYGVPPVRAQALEFWGGLVHATTLLREQAQRFGSTGVAAQPVAAVPSSIDSIAERDTGAPQVPAAVSDSLLAAPLELERAPLVLEDSGRARSPVGPAPFRMSGARYGWISVTVGGGTAPIIINGQSYGSAPQIIRVEKGAYIVTVRGAGDMFMPFQHDVVVEEGDTVTARFEVPVRRVPAAPPPLSDSVQPAPPAPPPDSTPPRFRR